MFWYRKVDTTPSASISSISITTNVSIQERGLNSPGFHVIDTYHTINCLATGKEKITAPASRSPTSITTINRGYNERGNNSPCWYVIDTYQLSTVYQLSGHRKGKIPPTPPPPPTNTWSQINHFVWTQAWENNSPSKMSSTPFTTTNCLPKATRRT